MIKINAPLPITGVTGLESTNDPRQQAFQRNMAGLLGQSLQGDVLAKLTDGSHLVRIAGNSARMLLPPGAQVGTQVPLTLVALTPRPTFQIGSPGGQLPMAYSEAGPALPPGAAARAAPLVYMEARAGAPITPSTLPGAAAQQPAAPARNAPGLPGQAASLQPPVAMALAPGLPGQPVLPIQLPLPGQAMLPGQRPVPGQVLAQGQPALDASDEAADASAPARAEGARSTAHAAALLRNAPLVPASLLPAFDASSTPTTLSEAARVITGVLTAARAAPQPPAAIVAPAPLLPSAAAAAPEAMAAALKQAVAQSGLFYESHVAEWSAGKRPIAELLQEPQMQRAALAPAEGQARQSFTDPVTAQFINLQLQTQEHARIAWQGQLWPGQDLQWEIERDAPERQQGGDTPPEATWRSALRLRFELLGDIGASVVMVGEQIHIALDAGSSEIGALLREHAASLDAAMDASGNPLSSLNIRAGRGSADV